MTLTRAPRSTPVRAKRPCARCSKSNRRLRASAPVVAQSICSLVRPLQRARKANGSRRSRAKAGSLTSASTDRSKPPSTEAGNRGISKSPAKNKQCPLLALQVWQSAPAIATEDVMKRVIIAAFSLTVCVEAAAQEPGKLAPLPDKLPPSVEARVGKVEFNIGLSTQKGIEQLFEIQDFQRAVQLYQWAIPAIGVMGWHRASIANGKTGEIDWVIYDAYVPRQGILTPNTEVSYVMAFPDLEKTGPLVLDYAPGKIAGIVMDYWQRPLADYGLTGPERGATGGRLLILGPGQKAPDEVTGYHVIQMPTRFAFIGYRVLDRSEKDKLTPLNKLYPYSERNNPPSAKVIAATKDYTQSAPRGLSYWDAVNELVQRETVEDRDRFFYAMLRDLGIEKGKTFKPNERQKKLLEDAALLGEEITKVVVYEKRFIGNYYPKTPGVGSIYLSTYR